jgi:hypothetical protein
VVQPEAPASVNRTSSASDGVTANDASQRHVIPRPKESWPFQHTGKEGELSAPNSDVLSDSEVVDTIP